MRASCTLIDSLVGSEAMRAGHGAVAQPSMRSIPVRGLLLERMKAQLLRTAQVLLAAIAMLDDEVLALRGHIALERGDLDRRVREWIERELARSDEALEAAVTPHDVEALLLCGNIALVRLYADRIVRPAIVEELDRSLRPKDKRGWWI